MKKVYLLMLGLWYACGHLQAQGSFVPVNADYQHLVERYEILQGNWAHSFHTAVKSYNRHYLGQFADSLRGLDSAQWSKTDLHNLAYLTVDNWEWSKKRGGLEKSKKPVLKHFYRYKPDFFNVRNTHFDKRIDKGADNFDVHVNPVLHVGMGYETDEKSPNKTIFLNSRGAEVRGTIADRIGFYTYFTDNQIAVPQYVDAKIDTFSVTKDLPVVPQEAFAKLFKTTGYDFITARGYMGFKVTKMIDVHFGHDRSFVGNGYRSLILSDFSSPYLFLKLNTKFWKINYTNIFAQLTSRAVRASTVFPKKYFTFHYFSLNLTKNINIGIFESVVYGRKDNHKNDALEIGYLNPIIFYRSLEQNLGSGDNAIIGLNLKWNFLKKYQFYGQAVLDEFVLSEVKNGNGWWANKQGVQLGAKAINLFGIDNLDLQVEFNSVRPYMYTHNDDAEVSNYTNYNQPLAHPLGANFKEWIGILRYQPTPKLNLTAKCFFIKQGLDGNGKNWGANISLNSNSHAQDYGNKIGQGVAITTLFADFTATYQVKHNIFIDFKNVYRKQTSDTEEALNQNGIYSSLHLRMNIPQRLFEF